MPVRHHCGRRLVQHQVDGFVAGRQRSAATWLVDDVAALTWCRYLFITNATQRSGPPANPELASAITQSTEPFAEKCRRSHVAAVHHLPDDPVPRPHPGRR